VLERAALHCSAEDQVLFIKNLMSKYNVVDIGMDIQGCGAVAHLLVARLFPLVRTYTYNPQIKYMLVAKAQELFKARRVAFDLGDKELVSAFTSIKRTMTPSGKGVTFETLRRGNAHGDLAWALMHVFGVEPLGGANHSNETVLSEAI
jgi:hypothetical protein